jgi:hypothetical protein
MFDPLGHDFPVEEVNKRNPENSMCGKESSLRVIGEGNCQAVWGTRT